MLDVLVHDVKKADPRNSQYKEKVGKAGLWADGRPSPNLHRIRA